MRYYLIYDATHVIAIHKTKDSAIACYRHNLLNTHHLVLKEVETDSYGVITYEQRILLHGPIPTIDILLESPSSGSDTMIVRKDSFAIGKPFLS
jgi:hypothetical protein